MIVMEFGSLQMIVMEFCEPKQLPVDSCLENVSDNRAVCEMQF